MENRKKSDLATLPPVLEVFETILRTLPPGCATLQTEPQPDGDIYVRLIPRNPAAAPIAARGGGRFRYELVVGQGTMYEIKPAGNYLNRSAVEEVQAICSAVFGGNFEETVYTVGKTIAKTTGKLRTEGKTFKNTAWHEFYPLIPKKKRVIKYAPYCEPSFP